DITENELDKILKNLYSTNFFEDVKVQIKNNKLEIVLKEYPVINQLILIGEESNKYKELIKKTIRLKEKKSFIKSFLAKDLETIKKLYSSLGYNFSKVEAKIKTNESDNLDLIIEINRGGKTKISSINFVGNKVIKAKRLREIIASEENKFWKFISRNTILSENLISLDRRLLINYYKSIGFYDIKINSNIAEIKKDGNADLIYTIQEGNRYTINKISTNVDSVFDKKLFFPLNESYERYVGTFYSPFKIKKLLDELDELIVKNNLQFVEHNVQEILESDSINIVFNVFEGEKTLVERINITGNDITNEDVIRGELVLDEGDPFTKINLDKSIAEIKERNIFKDVNYEILDGSEQNLKIINLNVEEKPTGEISAGAGVGTNGGTIAMTVKENNWLGQGKNVVFEIELDEESLAGTLSYKDPNYDFLGNSINYSISSERNDKPDQGYENSIISASLGTSFEQYRDIFAFLGLSASYDDLRTQGTASSALKKQAGTFSELSGTYSFTYDGRNRAFKPTSGSVVSFGQSFPFYADKNFIGNDLRLSTYKTISEDVIGATKFYLSTVNAIGSDDVRLSKRRSLSSKRLRGFERNKVGPVDGSDHVGGNYAAALNFETSLPNLLPDGMNTDVGLFLDFGNVWGVDYDSSIAGSNKIRSSTGIMASWTSPLGPMTFTLSQNLSKADTDKTESFNFQLGTTF
ncbi:MAG: outer membrane protein assembly factor BamA, partial [Pseudomonadota bacterium]|nr:outer membrane protein assembly factor BamA [Pseudomonadota bacterium]